MKNKIKTLKAFTLIEMLIVIVIIGILAAALIPRLSNARGRANDTARKATLSQVAAALVSHQIDKWYFPQTCWDLSLASTWLLTAGLDSIPTDPANSTVNWFSWTSLTQGQYWYCAISKNSQDYAWFVLAATAETEWWANYVQCSASSDLWTMTFTQIQAAKCISFSAWTCSQWINWACVYTEWDWELRYIYIQ